jgi:hypothetical protein
MQTHSSLACRLDYLEALLREALHSGQLSVEAEATLYSLSRQSDLTGHEMRILEIFQDALHQGDIQRG